MHKRTAVATALASLAAICIAVSRTDIPAQTWRLPHGTVHIFRFSPMDKYAAFVLREPQSPAAIHRLIVVTPDRGSVLLDTHGYYATNLCFDSDASHVAVQWADAVRVYALQDGSCTQTIKKTPSIATLDCMGFSGDDATLIMSDTTTPSHISAWDVSTGKSVLSQVEVPHWAGSGVAPDFSKWFSHRGWVTPGPSVVDVKLGRRMTHCVRLPYPMYASFTPDSQNLLTVHTDGAILLWELRHTAGDGRSLLPSQNAKILASCTESGVEKAIAFAVLNKTDQLGYVAANRTLQFTRLPQLTSSAR